MSDTVELGENVRKLQEDVRGIKIAIDPLGAQFQAGLQQAAIVIGEHLAVQDRRIDSLTNVLKEHIEETSKTLARIEAKLP